MTTHLSVPDRTSRDRSQKSTSDLSKIQYAIALFVLGYNQTQQKGPTIREIGEYVDKTASLVDYHLSRLERAHYLIRQQRQRGTIQPTSAYMEKSFALLAQDPIFRSACIWLSSRNTDDLSVTLPLGEDFPDQEMSACHLVNVLFSSTPASLPTLYWNPVQSHLALSPMKREEGKRWRRVDSSKQPSFSGEISAFIELAQVASVIRLL